MTVRRTCSLIFLACVQSLAQAQASPQIAWRAPASCTRDVFDAELARVAGAQAREVEARVELTQHNGGWSTTVQLAGASRTLSLASCGEAQRAAALLIATALAPELVQAPADPITITPPASEPAPLPTPAPVHNAVGKPRELASRWHLRVGGLLALEALPGPSGGPALGVELTRDRFSSWLDVRYLVARRASDDDSTLRADIDLFAGALGTAWLWQAGRIAWGPLLELEAGVQRARAHGEQAARDGRAPWLAGVLGARLDVPFVHRVGASFYAAAALPFWRPAVQLGGEPPFHRTAPLGLRLGVLLRVALTKSPRAGQ